MKKLTDCHTVEGQEHLQNLPDNKAGLVWYTDRSKITSTWVYMWRLKREHTFILGLHIMVFQAEIYDIMACIMENIEMGYKDRNTYIISDSQAAIKALNFQKNSQLVWK